jgi:cytochrome b6-f complex iron-sulfur subunit
MPEKIKKTGNTNPGNRENKVNVTRRKFIRAGMGVAGVAYAAAFGYPVYRYLADPAEKAAAQAAETEKELIGADTLPQGSAMIFRFGGQPAIVIHHEDGSWVSFSAVCTHLACTVEFQKKEKRIHCACHGGTYDMYTGKNVSGPPPKPLTQYKVEVLDGKIKIART